MGLETEAGSRRFDEEKAELEAVVDLDELMSGTRLETQAQLLRFEEAKARTGRP